MQGWIKLHRRILEWEWYDDSKMVHLLLHLIMTANHKDGKWKGTEVKKGQLITGLSSLKIKTGISTQSLRTCLERLKSTGEITIKTTNKYSLVTIIKYDLYQNTDDDNKQNNNQSTINQQSTNKQLTTNKNVKKEENENNEKKAYRSFAHLSLSLDDFDKLNKDYSKYQIDSTLDSVENYKLNKKYKSLYLTAKKWLDKEPKQIHSFNKVSDKSVLSNRDESKVYYRWQDDSNSIVREIEKTRAESWFESQSKGGYIPIIL